MRMIYIAAHCQTKSSDEQVLASLKDRLSRVGLRLINEEKMKLVYCKDYKRKEKHYNVQFDFLGYSY